MALTAQHGGEKSSFLSFRQGSYSEHPIKDFFVTSALAILTRKINVEIFFIGIS
jgi:hypothetical protein